MAQQGTAEENSAAAQVKSAAAQEKIVVAHRGASGYLPEHTLEAKAMAYAMGADYIEQDVVMTRDNQLIVLHDITLDRTTDVASRFPGRARDDGHYYVVDFTLAELRTLRVREGVSNRNGQEKAIFENRFPVGKSRFTINTLQEEIELIQGLNRSTGKNVGIYPEVKSPAFHRDEGKDLSTALIAVLKDYGYTSKDDPIFVQTFEFEELKILHDQVLPQAGVSLRLVQLIADDEEFQWMFDAEGMARLARYADGIGPDKSLVIPADSAPGAVAPTDLVSLAHANGLAVHPYTFRLDPGQIPDYAGSFEQLLEQFYFGAEVDGLFTDFPDRAVQFLRSR
ncbi:MAG: glycerophosphodiester phosphodiesterase [Pseudomonadales bacterium]|nr:glycerophosphodiester phosphodiesterase [Pseudomonadales bacterium]MCP5348182.1 glycerophosphodiester phosphodiesterase [Pseudomonadales bacterium]